MNFLSLSFERSVEILYEHIKEKSTESGFRCPEELKEYEIEKYKMRNAVKGWKIYPALPNGFLCIFVDNEFPFTVPKVAVYPTYDYFLKYPHIEEDGYLCLSHDSGAINEKNSRYC